MAELDAPLHDLNSMISKTQPATFSICIPTYKRTHLLKALLNDLAKQTARPDRIVIIDGDPGSNQVKEELCCFEAPCEITYIPSPHSNAAFQRYLGMRYSQGPDLLVYLDDDLRIIREDALESLLKPFSWVNPLVVGVTGMIVFPDASGTLNRQATKRRLFLQQIRKLQRGSLTPSGHRVLPEFTGEDYLRVEWLRGGVMAFRRMAIMDNPYYPDIFALGYIRCGLGADDTFVSRWAMQYGQLILAANTQFHHPNIDISRAYPAEGFGRAYAAAYSRRFLNDHYRISGPPTLSDRVALVKSYAGTTLLAWMRAVTKPSKLHFALARGTTLGALHGLTRPPTAKRLTPDINWRADADEALKNAQVINNGSR